MGISPDADHQKAHDAVLLDVRTCAANYQPGQEAVEGGRRGAEVEDGACQGFQVLAVELRVDNRCHQTWTSTISAFSILSMRVLSPKAARPRSRRILSMLRAC